MRVLKFDVLNDVKNTSGSWGAIVDVGWRKFNQFLVVIREIKRNKKHKRGVGVTLNNNDNCTNTRLVTSSLFDVFA